jgi:tetratricopeptide (TPR) repeat protein
LKNGSRGHFRRNTQESGASSTDAPDAHLCEDWVHKGNELFYLHRHADAIACYDRALAIDPQVAQAWTGKGNALYALGRQADAIVCYDRPGVGQQGEPSG